MKSRPQKAAIELFNQRLSLTPITHLPPDLKPRSFTEAYAIQDALNILLIDAGMGQMAGHKIGCTTPVMQAFVNIPHPGSGRIFSRTVMHDKGRVPRSGFFKLGIECEIAVQLAQDLPTQAAPYTRESVSHAVGAVMVAMELVDERYEDYQALGVATLLADDFMNAGCVLGKPVHDWEKLDLGALEGRTYINGAEAGRGLGSLVLEHPLNALAWLANSQGEHGRAGLKAGEFVLLGSVVQTKWLNAGDHVRIEVDQLGELTLNVDA